MENRPIKSLLLEFIVILIVAAIGAFLGVGLQAQREHRQVIKNLTVLNCINRLNIGVSLMRAGSEPNVEWNPRYLISYYNLVWGDIADEYGTSTITYAIIVSSMGNVNNQLDSISSNKPIGTLRAQVFAEVSMGAIEIDSMLNKLNVTNESCYDFINKPTN